MTVQLDIIIIGINIYHVFNVNLSLSDSLIKYRIAIRLSSRVILRPTIMEDSILNLKF